MYAVNNANLAFRAENIIFRLKNTLAFRHKTVCTITPSSAMTEEATFLSLAQPLPNTENISPKRSPWSQLE